MTDPNASMTAAVEFQIRTENTTMSDWLDEWQERARDALDGEPETAAYEAAVSLDDESCVLVYERYAQGAASVKAHIERPAHTQLTENMGAKNMTKRRVMSTQFYDVPGYGWWSREQGTEVKEGAIVVLAGFRFEGEGLDAFLKLSGEHAAYCWDAEPDTLVYSGGIAAKDADRGVDVKAGDLVFVMACTDMDAVNKHAEDPNHVALGDRFAASGVVLENTFAKTYRTTGRGFIHKATNA